MKWESNDYVCKAAKNVDEAAALVEDGFDYVTDVEREAIQKTQMTLTLLGTMPHDKKCPSHSLTRMKMP